MVQYDVWTELEAEIKNCKRCPLHRNRKNAVPGEGPRDAKIMFIGEAPGATEDEMGRPFVGAAGKLLTLAIESIGLKREDVYITNVVKCRPPENREPLPEEIEACSIYLEKQIKLLQPAIIITLGNVAGKWVFEKSHNKWNGVMKMRGRVYELNLMGYEVKVIPTIHPAAALYNPRLRSILFTDFTLIKNVLEGATQIYSTSKARSLLDYIKNRRS